MKSEDRIQQECVMWFHNTFPELRGLLFHVPNGGARSAREGVIFKKIGVVAGVADLLFMYRGKTYCFELKNDLGQQSKKQIAWQNKVWAQGFDYFLIRTKQEFINQIKKILKDEI